VKPLFLFFINLGNPKTFLVNYKTFYEKNHKMLYF